MSKTAVSHIPVSIRPITPQDAKFISHYANDKEVSRNLASMPYPYTIDMAKQFIRQMRSAMKKETDYVFSIDIGDDHQFAGVIGLHNIDKKNRTGTLGYWLGKKFWGQGIMTEAVLLALNFAFVTKKLHRLSVSALERNTGSIRIIEKTGFKKEGIRRDAFFRDKTWQHSIEYGMLEDEYRKKYGKKKSM